MIHEVIALINKIFIFNFFTRFLSFCSSLKKAFETNIMENQLIRLITLQSFITCPPGPDNSAFKCFTNWIEFALCKNKGFYTFYLLLHFKMSVELTRNPKTIFVACPHESWRFVEISLLLWIKPHQFFLYGSNHVHVFIDFNPFLLD